jgi:hypothetical protein
VLHNNCRRVEEKKRKSRTQASQSRLQSCLPCPSTCHFLACRASSLNQDWILPITRQNNSVHVASTFGLVPLSFALLYTTCPMYVVMAHANICMDVRSIYRPSPFTSPPLQRLVKSLNQDPRPANAFSSFCSMALMNVVYGVRVPRARLMCALTICKPYT